MPNEPNNPMHDHLTAYAQERRRQAGQPFSVPPATRQKLHAEIARQYRATPTAGWLRRSWWTGLWLRPALAGAAIFAVVAGVALFWWNEHRPVKSLASARAAKGVDTAAGSEKAKPEVTSQFALADRPSAETGRELQTQVGAVPVAAPSPLPPRKQTAPAGAGGYGGGQTTAEGAADNADKAMQLAFAPPSTALAAMRPTVARELAPIPGAASGSRTFSNPASQVALSYNLAGEQPGTARPAAGAPQAAAPSPEAAAPTATQPVQTTSASRFALARVRSAHQTAEPPAAVQTQGEARAAELAQTRSLAQRFVQADTNPARRRNLNSPPPVPVLKEFFVDPQGGRLRITDADGSVYDGALSLVSSPPEADAGVRSDTREERFLGNPAAAAAAPAQGISAVSARTSLPSERNAAFDRAVPAAGDELQFSVAGTNLTLNQRVRFEGRLVLTNSPALAPWGRTESNITQAVGRQIWLSNSVVRGQATVGGRTRLEINAVPAGP